MANKLIVEWPLCDGNGVCTIEAPELLELDAQDNLVVITDVIEDALLAKAEAAVRVCPKHALRISRDV
jgi:ferredoxin